MGSPQACPWAGPAPRAPRWPHNMARHQSWPGLFVCGHPTMYVGSPPCMGSPPCIWVPHHVVRTKSIRYQVSGIKYQISAMYLSTGLAVVRVLQQLGRSLARCLHILHRVGQPFITTRIYIIYIYQRLQLESRWIFPQITFRVFRIYQNQQPHRQ